MNRNNYFMIYNNGWSVFPSPWSEEWRKKYKVLSLVKFLLRGYLLGGGSAGDGLIRADTFVGLLSVEVVFHEFSSSDKVQPFIHIASAMLYRKFQRSINTLTTVSQYYTSYAKLLKNVTNETLVSTYAFNALYVLHNKRLSSTSWGMAITLPTWTMVPRAVILWRHRTMTSANSVRATCSRTSWRCGRLWRLSCGRCTRCRTLTFRIIPPALLWEHQVVLVLLLSRTEGQREFPGLCLHEQSELLQEHQRITPTYYYFPCRSWFVETNSFSSKGLFVQDHFLVLLQIGDSRGSFDSSTICDKSLSGKNSRKISKGLSVLQWMFSEKFVVSLFNFIGNFVPHYMITFYYNLWRSREVQVKFTRSLQREVWWSFL